MPDKHTLKIIGVASAKLIGEITQDRHCPYDLLGLMQDIGLPIASSCGGEGVCLRCKFNGEILSCETQFRDLAKEQISEIKIDYL